MHITTTTTTTILHPCSQPGWADWMTQSSHPALFKVMTCPKTWPPARMEDSEVNHPHMDLPASCSSPCTTSHHHWLASKLHNIKEKAKQQHCYRSVHNQGCQATNHPSRVTAHLPAVCLTALTLPTNKSSAAVHSSSHSRAS